MKRTFLFSSNTPATSPTFEILKPTRKLIIRTDNMFPVGYYHGDRMQNHVRKSC